MSQKHQFVSICERCALDMVSLCMNSVFFIFTNLSPLMLQLPATGNNTGIRRRK